MHGLRAACDFAGTRSATPYPCTASPCLQSIFHIPLFAKKCITIRHISNRGKNVIFSPCYSFANHKTPNTIIYLFDGDTQFHFVIITSSYRQTIRLHKHITLISFSIYEVTHYASQATHDGVVMENPVPSIVTIGCAGKASIVLNQRGQQCSSECKILEQSTGANFRTLARPIGDIGNPICLDLFGSSLNPKIS